MGTPPARSCLDDIECTNEPLRTAVNVFYAFAILLFIWNGDREMAAMKIIMKGPAVAIDSNDQTITDVQQLRGYSGAKSEDSCVEYLSEPLADIYFQGGHLEFVFDESQQQLAIQTVYHAPRELKKKELKSLVEETTGQWSDGIGENGVLIQGDPEVFLMAVFPLNESNFVVEQIDDGVVIKPPRKSPLFAAAKNGDTAKLQKLLAAGENVNARDRDKSTPLLTAVANNQAEAVKLLIDAKAELNVGDKYGSTPVGKCAMFGYHEVLNLLLEAGADPNYTNPADFSDHPPLHMACNRGQFECVKLLVRHGASVNYQCTGGGYSALMHLKKQHVDIARFLIEHGADTSLKSLFDTGIDKDLLAALS